MIIIIKTALQNNYLICCHLSVINSKSWNPRIECFDCKWMKYILECPFNACRAHIMWFDDKKRVIFFLYFDWKWRKTKEKHLYNWWWMTGVRNKRQIYQKLFLFPIDNSFQLIALTACIRVFGTKYPIHMQWLPCILCWRKSMKE